MRGRPAPAAGGSRGGRGGGAAGALAAAGLAPMAAVHAAVWGGPAAEAAALGAWCAQLSAGARGAHVEIARPAA